MVLVIILEILICIITILISWWFVIYFKYKEFNKHYPGDQQFPIVGSNWTIKDKSQFLHHLLELKQKYGYRVRTQMGFRPPTLTLLHYKAVDYFLSSTRILEKAPEYSYLHRWLGTGLLTSHGEKWKKHRKLLTPAFHFQNLEQFTEVFSKFSNIMVEKLRTEIGNNCVDIYPYVNLCSLDIICASAMGTVVNAQKNSESKYVQCVKQMCKIVMSRITSVIKSEDFPYLFTIDYQRERKALKILHGYTESVILTRKDILLNDKESNNLNTADKVNKKKTFLDILLLSKLDGHNISDEDIRQEVDTFMFAGHDTTTSAISFTLHSIANHPNVQVYYPEVFTCLNLMFFFIQEKVINELTDIFSDDRNRCATYQDLQKMKYLELVIKESLRLYPSVPMIARKLHEDIEYDGHIIPKGVSINIVPFAIHRCPDVYPDPERFDPERFSLENQSQRSPYAHIPFSAGPRNCIGQKFAMLELKSVISTVLRNFELHPCRQQHKLRLIGETILKSSTGVCIHLKTRKMYE